MKNIYNTKASYSDIQHLSLKKIYKPNLSQEKLSQEKSVCETFTTVLFYNYTLHYDESKSGSQLLIENQPV